MGMAAASDNWHGPIPPDPEKEPPREAVFQPTVVLKLDEEGEPIGIDWDWADSYRGTTIDLGDSIEEVLEDDQACEVMDEFVNDWGGHGGKYGA
jgi:hypothetical protein